MYVQIGLDLRFTLAAPTPMVVMLYTHPSRSATFCTPEVLRTEPDVPVHEFLDRFGNRCGRLAAPAGELHFHSDAVVWDSGLPEPGIRGEAQWPVEALPSEALPFLLASRYCEVDLLNDTAWRLFGHLPPGWQRVQSVCDWVHQHVEFGYQYASRTKTAADVLKERRGVCRDFQHLAITFCRALNVPARYATGYLGDIGVPPDPSPMDFSAWFEVFLGGRWFTLDARHNQPRIARVLMARGQDATDVALTTSFGSTQLTGFKVWTDELPNYQPAPTDPAALHNPLQPHPTPAPLIADADQEELSALTHL